MNTDKKNARIAGLYYLLMAVTGPVGILIVPSKIMVAGDASATVQNLVSNELLFRTGIISSLICQISFIFLVLALDRLFQDVKPTLSKLMVSLVLVSVPVSFLNELFRVAALLLVKDTGFLKAFDPDQINALVLQFLNLHEQGILVAGIFWGLWLFPFGLLAYHSGFIPKVLGILLIIGGFSYVMDSFTGLLFPTIREQITTILLLPLSIGEISMVLWLLIKGVKIPKAGESIRS